MNTLFSCMGGKMKGKYRFVKELRSLVKRICRSLRTIPITGNEPEPRSRSSLDF